MTPILSLTILVNQYTVVIVVAYFIVNDNLGMEKVLPFVQHVGIIEIVQNIPRNFMWIFQMVIHLNYHVSK